MVWVSLAWLNARLRSGDYVMIHIRSHDMSADIHTKGFVDRLLFHRLKMLTNIYSLDEIDKDDLNPAPLDAGGQRIAIASDLNTQYARIAGGIVPKTNAKNHSKRRPPRPKPKRSHCIGFLFLLLSTTPMSLTSALLVRRMCPGSLVSITELPDWSGQTAIQDVLSGLTSKREECILFHLEDSF